LKLSRVHDIKATINVCGILAERYPDIVRRIHDDGHDVVSHSYAMDIIPIYLTEDEERANIRRTTGSVATGDRCSSRAVG
jgi:peptidoglycan/xylan/chitin deacetylase (PgdA/CDA1 family)